MIGAAFVKSHVRGASHAAKSRLTRQPLGASLEIRRIYSVLVRPINGRHAQSLISL
jgi:hypothetical protein